MLGLTAEIIIPQPSATLQNSFGTGESLQNHQKSRTKIDAPDGFPADVHHENFPLLNNFVNSVPLSSELALFL